MLRLLIRKDWHAQRAWVLGSLAAGLPALLLLGTGGEGSFFAGVVLLLSVLICLGLQLPLATVVGERTEQTLPFVLSLPVSFAQYTCAKVLANLLFFLLPWTLLGLGTCLILALRAGVPHGLLAFGVLVLVEQLAAHVLILGTALVSESQAWTTAVLVAANLFLQAFLYWVSHMPAVMAANRSPRIQWPGAALGVLAAELGAMALILLVALRLQARKNDYL